MYYVGSGQRAKQVLLTPFAVATDVTIVGGYLALVGGVLFVIAAGHAGTDTCLERAYSH